MSLSHFAATVVCLVVFTTLHVDAFPSEDALLIVSTMKRLSRNGPSSSCSTNAQLPVVSNAGPSCSADEAGRMRFASDLQAAQVCSGSQWLTLATAQSQRNQSTDTAYDNSPVDAEDSSGSRVGRDASTPARSCLEILREGHSHGSGFYWLQHRGYPTSYPAYCDMTTEGGGWTLFATKFSTDYIFNKPIGSFQVDSAASINQNHKGCIPMVANWTQVLFRFSHDNASSRLVYNRLFGGINGDVLDAALDCSLSKPYSGQGIPIGGFVRHSPYENSGARIPAKGFHTIRLLSINPSTHGISEQHDQSDKWIDMWNTADTSSSYNAADATRAEGTKCVAGTCVMNQPIWLMYR